MKYRVTIDGVEREVNVVLTPGGGAHISLDGDPVAADVVRVPGGVLLRMDGRIYDIAAGGTAEALDMAAGASRARVEVLSERMRAKAKRGGKLDGGGKDIRAPMPGRVVSILVEAGQELEAGAPCVVVEAMKMENELLAPSAGTVERVHVNEGVSVDGGTLLVTFS